MLILFSYSFVPAMGNKHVLPVSASKPYRFTASNKPRDQKPSPAPAFKTPAAAGTNRLVKRHPDSSAIGGPSQPEMSSFKSVGTDNMVNLFTGDFSYNIPLLDVGGYPVNIFYNGGISMEQEASWVGLGWNINPGNINRNMRGVPDDFNGEDLMVQRQKMKPNTTWGVSLAGDFEMGGVKNMAGISFGGSVGISNNSYLGPALELSTKGGVNLSIAKKTVGEKSAMGVGAGLSATVSSRDGLSLSPNVSLTSQSFANAKGLSVGIGLSTSYNSRTGIKQLQIAEQASFNMSNSKYQDDYYLLQKGTSAGASLRSTSISFNKPSYIPSIRLPITNEAYAGHFQLGGAMWGIYASAEVEAYQQKSEIAPEDEVQTKPMVGYLYYQKAASDPNAVMDFTRFNDNEVTNNTPIISAPQFSYDVYSIQGEGTGGTIRPYRDDLGTVRDNLTKSKDKSLSAGGDIGIPGHYGGNFNIIKTPSVIGEWIRGNKLKNLIGFSDAKGIDENVYFRNPGETSVLNKNQFDYIGGTNLVRFRLGTSTTNPTIEPYLEQFSKDSKQLTATSLLSTLPVTERKKRTQVTSYLTAEEATLIGLDTSIRSYLTGMSAAKNFQFDNISRVSDYRKKHHISQISVTEANGRRYVYGIPVYNIAQRDFSFSVDNTEIADDKVTFNAADTLNVKTANGKEGLIQITETPAYAHSFLLTGLLSPDYIDITGDGITEDDLGTAVKFNYSRTKQGAQWAEHAWRSPHTTGTTPTANFNAGNRTETKDDKGIISYGIRESWYVHSIESKSMVAIFTLEDRNDGKGATSPVAGVNTADLSLKRLKKIDLYNKADLKKNGLSSAKPIKTVWFAYSYSLCSGTPDNASGGKLTLDSIYFTYNGKDRGSKNKYVFSYGSTGTNPAYAFNASDRWGNYKPKSMNPAGLKNADYPYAIQDKTQKAAIDSNAAAWNLKKILLPSGAQLEVSYESDDYAFVQNRRATDMMEIAGLGKDATTITSNLYTVNGLGITTDHDYVFIKVPEACTTKAEVLQKYLLGIQQLAFKLSVNMEKGPEFIPCYATIADYGVFDATRIWVKLNQMDGLSPLSLAALEYLRQRLPGQAFPGYDVSEGNSLEKTAKVLDGMRTALTSAFKDPVNYLRKVGKAQTINTTKSFVRLNDPDGVKYGGGYRVKSVILKDNWHLMSAQDSAQYGQVYDYTTTETLNGVTRKISSGVASYEPSIGGEENPFQTIVQVTNTLPLGPASYGAIEMPVLDAFFPAAVVGYSKVTVTALKKATADVTKKSRSGIGRQVTEFYTAKDFPVYYSHTTLDAASDKQEHKNSMTNFFFKYAFDSRALSQGFLVETNDMHGKMKSQSSYAENDTATRINYTENFYRNTGARGLNDKFDFVYAAQGGLVEAGNMGIDVELMTDTREFAVKTSSLEVQGQLDWFVFGPVSFWLPFIWKVNGVSETNYRAVTTTKTVEYHGVLDSIVVIDKGSQVSTRNLVYDAETGEVVVTRTNNEFDKPVYNINYPAYWAYSGMGLAYKNIDAVYSNVIFLDGKITSGNVPAGDLESGDELYLVNPGTIPANCNKPAVPMTNRLVWAVDKNKNSSGLTNTTTDFIIMDSAGAFLSRSGATVRIVRSGKRNLLGTSAASVVSMTDPVVVVGPVRELSIPSTHKVISASATEYREKWQADDGVIQKRSLLFNSSTCTSSEIIDCSGYLEKHINPYKKGLLGDFAARRALLFYGSRLEKDPLVITNLPANGFLENFKLYWDFNASNNLVPDLANTQWVWNTEVTRVNAKGLEVETRDALNIYTAAQYGFKRTLPVAITTNARSNETVYEGFEDLDYEETINNALYNTCAQPQLDLRNLSNSSIVNTDLQPFKAHSGNYVLSVAASSTASKQVKVNVPILTDFSFDYSKKDTVKSLYQTGQNVGNKSWQPANSLSNSTDFVFASTNTLLNFEAHPLDSNTSYGKYHRFNIDYTFYMDVPASGNYPFGFNFGGTDHTDDVTATCTVSALSGEGPTGMIFYAKNCFWTYPNTGCSGGSDNTSRTVYLCKGTYQITLNLTSMFTCGNVNPPPNNCSQVSHNVVFQLQTPFTRYKSLTTQNGCISTIPVAATDSMINPVFSVPVGKRMVFSAWVREDCASPIGGVSCSDTGYVKNKVILSYTGSSQRDTLYPSGAIIEGWQRYEGYFVPPPAATQMTMDFVNSNNRPLYFDDIRLHPFNANMKSYVYDPITLRLVGELDENNYGRYYEYDEEGTLIRTKAETAEGVKTINETRSFKQRKVNQIQP
ncbi:hypothetical protein FPE01S_03_01400 [Flavihumibacter petaseus NBRC 106054]|uniref:PA14 domain-containing protein n=2 Tax=Flavihumibacter TaxID=1004301 RepID=A0A0E9N354_9BACT|nr:hypothetical protein FPE01S_03_01400 [Flavihumibacter petaseus NBRC 106054]